MPIVLAMFSPIEMVVVLVCFVLMLAVAAGVVYGLYRLQRRAARDGVRDAAARRNLPPR